MRGVLIGVAVFVFWDASLHIAQLLNLTNWYALYPYFGNTIVYNIFWSGCWIIIGTLILRAARRVV